MFRCRTAGSAAITSACTRARAPSCAAFWLGKSYASVDHLFLAETGWNRARGMIPLDGTGCAVSIDGAKATLKALPRNSHLQRCYAAAAVVTEGGNEVTLEVRASGGAHLAARVSQVIWSSSEP